jgi:hypothetical protein
LIEIFQFLADKEIQKRGAGKKKEKREMETR